MRENTYFSMRLAARSKVALTLRHTPHDKRGLVYMIVQHLLDTLILMIWMVVIGLALMGWGEIVRHWLKFKSSDHRAESTATQALCDIWFGLCICISVTELLHFFFAITWVVSVGVLGAGLAYSLVCGKLSQVGRLWRELLVKPFSIARGLYYLAFLAACFIWISVAMGGPTNYDSGLYHFGSIKWLNEHSITYGLVNLHTRLAYNQSYFALIALLNFSPIYDRAYAGTGVFLFLLTASTCVQLLQEPLVKPRFLLSVLLVLTGGFILKASSPTPDLAVGLFQLVIFLIVLRVLLTHLNKTLLSLLLILCVTALTIKLSTIVFCAAAVCVAHRDFWSLFKSNRSLVVRLLILCLLMLVIHALRGYALSGMPLYPSTFAGLWALPYAPNPARVLAEANSIYSWARLPGVAPEHVLSNWDWIKPWSNGLPTRFLVLAGVGTALFVVNLVLFKSMLKAQKRALWLYLPLLLSVGFWFLTAPDIRFLGLIPELAVAIGAWLLYLTAANFMEKNIKNDYFHPKLLLSISVISFVCVTLLYTVKASTGIRISNYFPITDILYGLSQIGINYSFFLTALFGLLIIGYHNILQHPQSPITRAATAVPKSIYIIGQHALMIIFLFTVVSYIANLALFKATSLTGWKPIPTEPYDHEKLHSGLFVNVPKSDDLCWNAPLPCLPRQQFNDRLEKFNLFGNNSEPNSFRVGR